MKCLIISSSLDITSDIISKFNNREYFVICADGGLDVAYKSGLLVDLLIGDMDSVRCSRENVNKVMLFPEDKDYTDTHLAVIEALKRGYKDIYIVGATGGRLDHEYANYCLLKYILINGGFGRIINQNNIVYMTDKSIEIESSGMKYISFYPFGGNVINFSAEGVKYELKNHTLTDTNTLTTSNEFVGNLPARISFKEGYVLIICSDDN